MHHTEDITFGTDILGRKELSVRLEHFLANEKIFVTGSLVVYLNAPLGSRKTTFLEMWHADLNKIGEEKGQETFLPIFRNAWESDFCADPLGSLLCSLIDSLEKCSYRSNEKRDPLIKATKAIGWLFVSIGNNIDRSQSNRNRFITGKKIVRR